MSITDLIANLFGDSKNTIRLAVVGPTSSGKTYLLTDIIGSLIQLGYKQKDRLANKNLHHSVLELITDVTDEREGVRTTEVYACRSHNHYSSDFTGVNNMHLEFLDVPGEVMTPESIRIFHAVMKALMACTQNVFIETQWRNIQTGNVVKTVDFNYQEHDNIHGATTAGPILRDPRRMRRQVVLGQNTTTDDGGDGSTDIWAQTYMTSESRRAYYRQIGFEPGRTKNVSGRKIFEHFFDYDTDTLVNAIGDAWMLLDIDSYLTGGATGYRSSQRNNFIEVYRNHFYFHYFTFYATDVVVCDKCCVPMSAGLVIDSGDHFSQMMHSLVALTAYADMTRKKNWYLAFKGIDAILRQEPFANLYQLSNRDLNLVYTQFLTLFRIACTYKIMDGRKPYDLMPPFNDDSAMQNMLAGSVPVNPDALQICADQYQTLIFDGVSSLFKSPEDYTMISDLSIEDHIMYRIRDFMLAAPQWLQIKTAEGNLLNMPPHVFFTATPIDTNFNIYGHDPESNRVFDGAVSHFNHRAFFGALQLTTCILREHGLCPPQYKSAEGDLLTYVYDVRY